MSRLRTGQPASFGMPSDTVTEWFDLNDASDPPWMLRARDPH
jgi:hypothetical protein